MTDTTLDASVVIPTYNSRDFLLGCLDALTIQTHPRHRFEIIVADNGSTDGTREMIRADHPDVRIVPAPRKGSGHARNAGILAARCELILNTDADCLPDRDWVATMVALFAKAPPKVACIGGAILPYSQRTLVERYRETWVQQPEVTSGTGTTRFAATANAAIRASVVRELDGFDGEVGHDDTDFGMRLAAAGYTVEISTRAIVRHHNPADLKTLFRHRKKYGESNFKLARKHPRSSATPAASRNAASSSARPPFASPGTRSNIRSRSSTSPSAAHAAGRSSMRSSPGATTADSSARPSQPNAARPPDPSR